MTDHHVGVPGERNGPADERQIAAEATFPETFTQDDNVAPVRPILIGCERPTRDHTNAEQPEEVGADHA